MNNRFAIMSVHTTSDVVIFHEAARVTMMLEDSGYYAVPVVCEYMCPDGGGYNILLVGHDIEGGTTLETILPLTGRNDWLGNIREVTAAEARAHRPVRPLIWTPEELAPVQGGVLDENDPEVAARYQSRPP